MAIVKRVQKKKYLDSTQTNILHSYFSIEKSKRNLYVKNEIVQLILQDIIAGCAFREADIVHDILDELISSVSRVKSKGKHNGITFS